jgi:REP element-mobilizing transposase RayT
MPYQERRLNFQDQELVMARPATRQRRSRKRRSKQLTLEYRTWGGFRKGSGRKPKGERAGVAHTKRPLLPSRYPVHVTNHLCDDLPNLRKRKLYQKLRKVFYAMHGRPGFRIVHFSVQRNHIHLIVEAKSKTALSRGMQSFKIRFANEVNNFLGRGKKGTVFADRYYSHILKSPTETRNSIAYVVLNGRRHRVG